MRVASLRKGRSRRYALIKEFSPESKVEDAYAFDAQDDDWYNWTGIKYFLYEYEAHLAEKRNKNLAISWRQLERRGPEHSIEHILPQNPTEEYWLSRWSKSEREKYTNDIGNLCLTLDNSSYGNKPFPEKRGEAGSSQRCYATGDLVMERELAAYDDWTEERLVRRRQGIVDWARGRWGQTSPSQFDWCLPAIEGTWQFRVTRTAR